MLSEWRLGNNGVWIFHRGEQPLLLAPLWADLCLSKLNLGWHGICIWVSTGVWECGNSLPPQSQSLCLSISMGYLMHLIPVELVVLLLQITLSLLARVVFTSRLKKQRNYVQKLSLILNVNMYLIYSPHSSTSLALIFIYLCVSAWLHFFFSSPTLSLSIFLWLWRFSGAPHVIQSVDSVCLHASQLLSCDWNIRQGGPGPRDAPGLTRLSVPSFIIPGAWLPHTSGMLCSTNVY